MSEHLKIELLGDPSLYYVTDGDEVQQPLAYSEWYLDDIPESGTVLWADQPGEWGGDEYATIKGHAVSTGWGKAGVVYVTCDQTVFGHRPHIYTGDSQFPSGDYQAYWTPENDWDEASKIPGGMVRVTHFNDPTDPAINPDPEDGAVEVDGEPSLTLSWDSDARRHTVYVSTNSSFSASDIVVEDQEPSQFYTLTEAQKARFTDLEDCLYWRVDSIGSLEGGGNWTVGGNTWTFDPRPAKVESPVPDDEAADISLNLTEVSWDASDTANTYNVYFNGGIPIADDLVSVGQAGTTCSTLDQPLPQRTQTNEYVCTWRIDSTNRYGTTEGDEWTFLTRVFAPPSHTIRNAETGALVAAADYDPTTDYITGENFMTVVRRLVAAAKDAIYYEGIL